MTVAWDGVVVEMTSHHAAEPAALIGDGSVPASLELDLESAALPASVSR